MNQPHISVLKEEVLSLFKEKELKYFIDGTLGAGGHAEAILLQHPELEIFFGIDQDLDALKIAKMRLKQWENRIQYLHDNFDIAIPSLLKKEVRFDGILLDLGVSSMQLDRPERGFSFMRNGPLDMRMNNEASLTALEVVNTWSFNDLCRIFREYGEEKQWRKAAFAIVEARKEKEITTTHELVEVLTPVLRKKRPNEINPLTLIFQGLRICVNRELEVIEKTLPLCVDLLNPGGRLAVITFHSLEDRIVKNHFKYFSSDKMDTSGIAGVFQDKKPIAEIVTRKPICASKEEIDVNVRSRSAKLRCIQKL